MNRPLHVVGLVFPLLLLGAVAAVYFGYLPVPGSASRLPSYCHQPPGGYLIVASSHGFNDSIDHGAPTNLWPLLYVSNGTTVKFVVCNTDSQVHSFQVTHYEDARIEEVAPGQSITVSFVANQRGVFNIHCGVFSTIHWAMQSGLLVVS